MANKSFLKQYPWAKYVMIAGLGFMVYRTMKKNGGTLSNNADNMNVIIDTDKMVDMMFAGIVSPKSMPFVKHSIKTMANNIAGQKGIKVK